MTVEQVIEELKMCPPGATILFQTTRGKELRLFSVGDLTDGMYTVANYPNAGKVVVTMVYAEGWDSSL